MKTINSKTFFFLVFVISFIVITLGGFLYYKNFERRFLAEIESKLTSIATLKIEELSHWKKERFGDASMFTFNKNYSGQLQLFLKSEKNIESRNRLLMWLVHTKRAYDYDRVTLYDTLGNELLFSEKEGINQSLEHSKQEFYFIKDRNKIQLIDFYKPASTGSPHLGIYVPLFSVTKEDSLIGFMTLCVAPDKYLYPFIQRWPGYSNTGETLILRKENDSVLFLNPLKYNDKAALNFKLPLDKADVPAVKAVMGETGIVYGNDYRGVPVVAYVSQVNGFPWYLVAKLDQSEAYAPLYETIYLLLVLLSSLIVGSAISMRYLWKRQRTIFYRDKYEDEKALREKQELYKTLINNLHQRVFFKDTKSVYVSCNEAFADERGLLPEEVEGKTDYDFYTDEFAEKYRNEDRFILSNSKEISFEENIVKNDETRTYTITKIPIFSEEQSIMGILGILDDITKRKQDEANLQKMNRLYSVLSNINQSIVRLRDPQELFEEICKISVQDGKFLFTWIGVLNPQTNDLKIAASYGDIKDYLPDMNIFKRNEMLKNCPIKFSLDESKAGLCDLEDADAHYNCKTRLREKGINSIAAFPLFLDNKIYGVISFYSSEVGFFDSGELRLLEELALDLSFALEFFKKESELENSLELLKINQARLELSQSIAHVASWEFNPATGKIWGSKEGFKIYGLTPEASGNLPIEEIEKCIPEKERVHQAMVDLLNEEKEYNLEFSVNPANGEPQRIIISKAQLVKDRDSSVVKVSGFIQDVTEQRKAERKLLESQNLFKTIADTSPAMIWMSGTEKGCTWFNKVWLNFTGRTIDQELGAGWSEGVYPDDLDLCLNTYLNAFDKRESFEMEYRLKRYDGLFRWIIDKGDPRYDAGNNFAGYIGTCIDITERKNIEAMLTESEEKYRLLAETAKDVILIQNFDSEILYINKAGCDLVGLSSEECYKKNVRSFIPRRYHDMLDSFISERHEGFSGPRIYELEFIDQYKNSVPVEIISAPIMNDKNISSILVIARDITERKRNEEELKILNAELESRIKIRTEDLQKLNIQLQQQIEERIQIERETAKYANEVSDLYNNAPCGYHSLDHKGIIVSINDTELNWLQYDRSEIIDKKRFEDFFTEESKKIFRDKFPLFLKQGWIREIEFDIIRKDGSLFSVILSATAVKDNNGNFIKSRSTIFDITEIKRAKQEIESLNRELSSRAKSLELANKELEAFAYSVSHDLRAPLRAIDGFAKIVTEDYSDKLDEEGKRLFGIIRNNTKKMDQLIVDLLALSKVTRTELKHNRIDMTAMAKALYFEVTSENERGEINFILSDLPDISGDPVLMRQVWSNLLSNAVKYTRKAKERIIEAGSIADDKKIIYFIKDNGVGFNTEYKDKLFGVFQRLHNSDEFEGTGVGLAIVKRIISRHGGAVWAESVQNEGAVFYFELPKM